MSRLVLGLLLASATLAAGDREFDSLVRGIETDYGVRRTRIPLFGVVNFFVKVSRPAGASDLRLAIFENFSGSGLHEDFSSRLSREWTPFVRVISHHGRETTLIYANVTSKHFKMLIANVEPHETTMVQVRLSQKALQKWFDDPPGHARHR